MTDDAKDGYPGPVYAWFVVAVLMLAFAVSFVDRQILGLLVAPISEDLGLSDTEVSVLHGFAFAIFYTLLGIPLGRWADHHHRVRMIIIGIVVWSLATVACGFASNFWELFTARVFVGAGEATLSPAAYSLLADYFRPAQRARAMSVYSLGVVLGAGAAFLLGGAAIAATADSGGLILPLVGALAPWQAAFVIVGAPGLVVAALMFAVRETPRKERTLGGPGDEPTLVFLRARAGVITLVCLGFGMLSTNVFGFSAWLPTMFIRNHGWSAPQIAGAMGISVLTFSVAGAIIGGMLADRLAARNNLAGAITVSSVAVACVIPALPIVGLAPNPLLSLAALSWVNFFIAMPVALAMPTLQGVTPNQHRGQMAAIYVFATSFVGLGIGPTLIAATTDFVFKDENAVGASLALVTTSVTTICLIMLLAARRPYRALAEAATWRAAVQAQSTA